MDIDLKAVAVSGCDEIRQAMALARANRLDGNFIEGMMCEGGCIGGAGTIVSRKKSKPELMKYSGSSGEKSLIKNRSLEKFEGISLKK